MMLCFQSDSTLSLQCNVYMDFCRGRRAPTKEASLTKVQLDATRSLDSTPEYASLCDAELSLPREMQEVQVAATALRYVFFGGDYLSPSLSEDRGQHAVPFVLAQRMQSFVLRVRCALAVLSIAGSVGG